MNIPNQLILCRLGLTALFVLCTSAEWEFQALVGLLLFVVASITDWLDGFLARRWNQITDFGKLFDPLADKILVAAALVYLVSINYCAGWMAILMVSREFLITGLRGVAAHKGVVMAAERLGKHKTVSQMVAILATLLYIAVDEVNRATENNWMNSSLMDGLGISIPWLFSWATLITLWSGIVYFVKNRHLLDESPSDSKVPPVIPPGMLETKPVPFAPPVIDAPPVIP